MDWDSLLRHPQVPITAQRVQGPVERGDVIWAIEPMIQPWKSGVYTESDGWTVRTRSSAFVQFEAACGDPDGMRLSLAIIV